MMHNAIRAFLDKNPDLARATMAAEPRVNEVRDAINAQLVDWRGEGRVPIDALPPMITVARRFERVSDQATNICEEAVYFATGEYQRHRLREGFRVLFVDESNNCLSQMAEAIANHLAPKRFTFASAGVVAGAVDPQTIQFLAGKGIDASHHRGKAIGEIPDLAQLQVIVALNEGAQCALPRRPSKTLGIDWYVLDPSKQRGTPAGMKGAYEGAFDSLSSTFATSCRPSWMIRPMNQPRSDVAYPNRPGCHGDGRGSAGRGARRLFARSQAARQDGDPEHRVRHHGEPGAGLGRGIREGGPVGLRGSVRRRIGYRHRGADRGNGGHRQLQPEVRAAGSGTGAEEPRQGAARVHGRLRRPGGLREQEQPAQGDHAGATRRHLRRERARSPSGRSSA